MDRRHFILLTAAMTAGCEAVKESPHSTGTSMDAGPASQYAAEGVYTAFVSQGFFIVNRAGKLFALSAICTHRHCKLTAEADHSFYCPCHGSTFDPIGKVTEGPATRDLPMLISFKDERGHFMVKTLASA